MAGSGAAGTAGTAGGGMAALLRFTGGTRGLEGLWVKPAWRYPSGGRSSSTGGTGSGKSGAVNFAGLALLVWMVRSTSPSS